MQDKDFNEPRPNVTEDALHLDDLFMLLDYYTLPGDDNWPDRFPAFPEYVIDCYRRFASFPFRTSDDHSSLPDEAATLASVCLMLLNPESEKLHDEIGNLLYPALAQVANRGAFGRRWLDDVLATSWRIWVRTQGHNARYPYFHHDDTPPLHRRHTPTTDATLVAKHHRQDQQQAQQ
ncbi:hypothetical protein BAY61_32050 (plasmid) [Prauserella marina]|uniref:Uncharacterized protein n=1 Tax=Prauserella marina TaxID=530584 RepID=A0A222W132_9PSEU|nr:hypothetical protein [Prauserella marina]ASR39918.1 hypothetical protein BAY61_32050 [Prauserella marina]PWV71418.1 hypothetical protein DES30_112134 [Prauserella marina]SDD98118.1 hypothetical protein SAMN05421630_115145 [Prauserella marina]